MWYKNENGSITKPEEIDRDTSKVYVFVRKDFVEVPADGDDHPAHWEWMERKIRKDDWATYQTVMGHETALDDVYAALTELAEIIAGEE